MRNRSGPATIYRNYFAPVGDAIGQTRDRQIDGFSELGAAIACDLGKAEAELWSMRMGYAMFTRNGRDAMSSHVASLEEDDRDGLRQRIRIGVHHEVEVTNVDAIPGPSVSQAFCSALPVDIRSFDRVDESTLSLAHDSAYVRGVLEGMLINGFGNRRADVAASLPYTNGAMLAAAREAIANRRVACAPVSGFHHACYGHAEGFCTFNGLMVTALALKRDGLVDRVGILDLDHHWGDGTDDIIGRLHIGWMHHHTSGKQHPEPEDAAPYLARLASLVISFMDCSVLLYQAGADAHVKDPLGGWMTSEQLAERDRIVFETAATIGLPVAWNLAGGYQTDADGGIAPVLKIHRQTMRARADVYVA